MSNKTKRIGNLVQLTKTVQKSRLIFDKIGGNFGRQYRQRDSAAWVDAPAHKKQVVELMGKIGVAQKCRKPIVGAVAVQSPLRTRRFGLNAARV